LIALDQIPNFVVKSCTEEDGLSVWEASVKNVADRFHEPHVSHSVGFVNDNNFNILEDNCTSFHQIKQTPWASYDNVQSALKGSVLILVRNSTIDGPNSSVNNPSKWLENTIDLFSQLSGWS